MNKKGIKLACKNEKGENREVVYWGRKSRQASKQARASTTLAKLPKKEKKAGMELAPKRASTNSLSWREKKNKKGARQEGKEGRKAGEERKTKKKQSLTASAQKGTLGGRKGGRNYTVLRRFK